VAYARPPTCVSARWLLEESEEQSAREAYFEEFGHYPEESGQ
jgi:hypothetical protein